MGRLHRDNISVYTCWLVKYITYIHESLQRGAETPGPFWVFLQQLPVCFCEEYWHAVSAPESAMNCIRTVVFIDFTSQFLGNLVYDKRGGDPCFSAGILG